MSTRKLIAALAGGAVATTICFGSIAQEKFPLVNGDYWEVTGVELKDGGSLK